MPGDDLIDIASDPTVGNPTTGADVPANRQGYHMALSPLEPLINDDGHGYFDALGDSVATGPTLTNVNHFRAILTDTH